MSQLTVRAIHNLRLLKNDSKVGERHTSTGYIYSGLSISGVHQLGLNVNVSLVAPVLNRCIALMTGRRICRTRRNVSGRTSGEGLYILDYIPARHGTSSLSLASAEWLADDRSRAFASGRPPLLSHSPSIALPVIDANIDDTPWLPPTGVPLSPGQHGCVGRPGLYTKTLHHATQLVKIGRAIMEAM